MHKREYPVPSGGRLEIGESLDGMCLRVLYRSCLVIVFLAEGSRIPRGRQHFHSFASTDQADKGTRHTPRQPTSPCPNSATNGLPSYYSLHYSYYHSTTRLEYAVPVAAERKPTSFSYPSSSLSYAQVLHVEDQFQSAAWPAAVFICISGTRKTWMRMCNTFPIRDDDPSNVLLRFVLPMPEAWLASFSRCISAA